MTNREIADVILNLRKDDCINIEYERAKNDYVLLYYAKVEMVDSFREVIEVYKIMNSGNKISMLMGFGNIAYIKNLSKQKNSIDTQEIEVIF